jgi:hypothetical protein
MPPFNHSRADGLYDPCDLCWAEMSETDKLRSVLGASTDPYEDRCILECTAATGKSLGPFIEELRAEYHGR